MSDEEKRIWYDDNMSSPQVLRYKLSDLKEDMAELKKDMRAMSEQINQLTKVHSSVTDIKRSLDNAWVEIRAINERCLSRQHQIDWVKQHEDNPTSEEWYNKMVSGALSHGLWILLTAVIVTFITKVSR
jgi:predicted  nucleic acid-binding Zn-ribbon protein